MTDTRVHGAKKNILVSLGCQMVTLLCGIIVPKLMIDTFGSETYGATVSIAQFLSYITLLEGGIGGVARAALYRPLAENDSEAISAVMSEIKRFFRIITCIFLVYVLFIACFFNKIARIEAFDWLSTFLLVLAIGLSTFGQYYIGVSNMILLQAAQKSYVTNMVNIAGMAVNTVMIVILVSLHCHIIIVKLISSVVFTLKPIVLWMYVQKHYHLRSIPKTEKSYLTQKWSGLGQHLAFFLHSNTDVVILTCFSGLKSVAVYSVYQMIVSNIQNLAVSFMAGMEAIFGDMLAKKEKKQLEQTFDFYETIISMTAVVLFSVTAVMMIPFVRIYTMGVADANYEAPLFAWLLTMAALFYCLRMPYHSVIIAAGHFKQTRIAAYGEAAINVILSVFLVSEFGLVGVAGGTLTATCFRMIYYVYYLSKRILNRNIFFFIKRSLLNAVAFFVVVFFGTRSLVFWELTNYGVWAIYSALLTVFAVMVGVIINLLFYCKNFKGLLAVLKAKR